MRKLKAFFFTLWLYTFLLWFYDVLRIVVDNVPLNSLFMDSVPYFTFIDVGADAFILSMIFLFIYLIIKN